MNKVFVLLLERDLMLELVQDKVEEPDKNEETSTINTAHVKSYVQTSQ